MLPAFAEQDEDKKSKEEKTELEEKKSQDDQTPMATKSQDDQTPMATKSQDDQPTIATKSDFNNSSDKAKASKKIPVVVLYKVKPTAQEKNDVQSNGGEITKSYNTINGFAANLTQTEIDKLKKDPSVISVDLDVEVHAFDIGADTQIRADQVWAKGDTGTGIPVAILDTGITTTHPEFSGRILKCHSEITNTDTCADGHGHGTHVAGIVGAAGVILTAKGVAPSTSLYVDQVLDSTGSGTISGVIAGIDWARTNGAKVISMSLGTSPISTSELNCDTAIPSLTTAINNAVAAGITVVAASGNVGTSGVGAPACIGSTIAVAAVDSANNIASFSSRGGPVADHGIAAPGVSIYSSWLSGGYATLSGTSMATPHVAGTIALLLKANPALLPADIKSVLFSTACTSSTTPSCPTSGVPNSVYGYGRVDALRAYDMVTLPAPDFSISASPSSLGVVAGTTGTSTITVTSIGAFSSEVLLGATSVPSGIIASFSPSSVTPTSGGSATSTLMISTLTAGTYALTVTGTHGTLSHPATIAVTASPPPVTCGAAFFSGAPIDYGTVKPGLESAEKILVINNTGTGMASLSVTGTNWFDGSPNLKMTIDKTRFGTSSGLLSSKTPLDSLPQTITTNFSPTTNLDTFWQVFVSPIDSTFVGQLTQTMTFSASC